MIRSLMFRLRTRRKWDVYTEVAAMPELPPLGRDISIEDAERLAWFRDHPEAQYHHEPESEVMA